MRLRSKGVATGDPRMIVAILAGGIVSQTTGASGDFSRDVYDESPCGLLSTTLDGIIIDANSTFTQWLRLSTQEVVGQSLSSLLDTGSRIFFETRYQQALHLSGHVDQVALTMTLPDGEPLHVLVNAMAVNTGDAPVVRVAVFDASARIEYERELLQARRAAEASEARVRVLQDVTSTFGLSVSDTELAESFVVVAQDAFQTTAAAVHLVDENGELQAVAGHDPLWGKVAPVPELRDTEDVVVVHVEDLGDEHAELAAAMREARLRSLTVAPLESDAGRLGVLVCFFGQHREFDAQDIDLQRTIGRQASQTIVRVRLQRQLARLALYDQLTGVANRPLIQSEIEAAIERAVESGRSLAVVFLDVDEFKEINDQRGHAVGDAVLQHLASRLNAGVRAGDLVGRIGGDEFVILCEDADASVARQIAERVRQAASEEFDASGASLNVSVSIGVSLFDPGTHSIPTADQILIRADGAMYRAKGGGKNQVTFDDLHT